MWPFRLDLCITEALDNVMHYAFDGGPRTQIRLSVDIYADRAVARIRDSGRPFDPLAAPRPEKPACLEDDAIGGLGLPILRRFATECHYQRDAGENLLTIVAASQAGA